MAASNSVTNHFRSGYSLRLDWTEYDINVANNTSSLAIAIHLISGGAGYYINSNATKYIHENIAGFQGDKTFSASLKGGEDKIIYWNFIENIQHSPDGSSSFWIGFDVGLNVTLSGVYWGNVSISDTVNLTKIARKSTLSVGNATIGAAHSMTIHRQDACFTHSISYYFGNASGTIPVSGTNASWTPPESLAAQIPSSVSGGCRLVLTTYVGGNVIGSNEYWITLSVPDHMVPTVSTPKITDASGSTKGWLRNYSRAKWSVSASGVQGSAITSCQLIFSNVDDHGGRATYSGTTGTASVFDRVGAVSVAAKVTDSRGRTAKSSAVTLTFKDYRLPEITEAKLMRCEADGKENIAGEYCKVTVAASIAATPDLAGQYILRYKKTSEASYPKDRNLLSEYSGKTSISASVIFAADGASPYDVELVTEDGVTSVSRAMTLSTAEVLMHFGSNGSSMAIGKIVELDERTLDVNWDTLFRNKVELRGSLTVDGKGSFTGGMDVRAARSNTPALRISSAGSEHSISYADSFIVGVGTGNIGGGAFGIYKTSGNGAGNVMTIDGNGQFQFNRHVTMKTLGSSQVPTTSQNNTDQGMQSGRMVTTDLNHYVSFIWISYGGAVWLNCFVDHTSLGGVKLG